MLTYPQRPLLNDTLMTITLPWQQIDTVLLDMDGTLLDLAFDREFWQMQVPLALSSARGISNDEASAILEKEYQRVEHALQWYCLDYWSDRLNLDIDSMLAAHGHRAQLRQDTLPFLDALKAANKKRILLTNAHPKNLAIKLEHTGLDQHLDLLLSTHTFGYPKEDQRLWQAVADYTELRADRTLFVDDSEVILDAANTFGIGYRLGVKKPDSGRSEYHFQRHQAVEDYRRLIPTLLDQEVK